MQYLVRNLDIGIYEYKTTVLRKSEHSIIEITGTNIPEILRVLTRRNNSKFVRNNAFKETFSVSQTSSFISWNNSKLRLNTCWIDCQTPNECSLHSLIWSWNQSIFMSVSRNSRWIPKYLVAGLQNSKFLERIHCRQSQQICHHTTKKFVKLCHQDISLIGV